RRTFLDAVAWARAAGDVDAIARAALGLHGLGQALEDDPTDALALVDEARAALEASPAHQGGSPLLARVLAAASQLRTHLIGEDRDAGETLSAAAVDMARRCGDPAALGFCLLAHHDAIWKLGSARARLALADEMTSVA